MRLFIAINFNDATKARLTALRDELRAKSGKGRFSSSDNIHLTLVFLGECDAGQAAAAKAAMDAVSFAPFDVAIDRVGRFRRDGGDIWWAGVRENKLLSNLHGDLTDKLTAAGFYIEKRGFSPHVTLGREVKTKEMPREIEPFGETVSSIELMKSERIGGKLTYTAVHKRT
jgi:2'-5' RNA ligase